VSADVVAAGGELRIGARGSAEPARIEVRTGRRFHPVGRRVTGRRTVPFRVPSQPGRIAVRVRGADGLVSKARRVRVRYLRMAGVGDINLGDGPGGQIALRGVRYPWTSVGPVLRAADLSFGNLECSVSSRGAPVSKLYTFRGAPSSLQAMARYSGLDAVSLANNHAADYGKVALGDTIRNARAAGIVPFGAGYDEQGAYTPRIVRRLGLRVAFVGFSVILPFEFRASGGTAGTAWAFPGNVQRAVRRARREADVVVAMFHWGVERNTYPEGYQRQMAQLALKAGATAVIGAHPHVLQPVQRPRDRLIAYSLGNFVFSANSPGTTRTGILEFRVARRRVAPGAHLRHATIVASRPVLDRPVPR
jgi:Bacterial capsule synthesis protein PGA_cap